MIMAKPDKTRPLSLNGISSSVAFILVCSLFAQNILVESGPLRSDYQQKREELIEKDKESAIGRHLVLTKQEQIVSDYLVKEKKKMIESSRLNKTKYYPAHSFYESKALIEQSPIYSLIKIMPKGAALHIHDLSITSLEWLVKNVTYRDNLYMCVNSNYFMIFKFLSKPVPNPGCEWQSVKELRAKANDVKEFDESLRRNISFLTTDPLTTYKDVNEAWDRFNAYFAQIINMVFYVDVFGDYYAQALKEFHEDNVQYIELRGQMWGTFDLDGKSYDAEFGLNLYRNVTRDFVKENPDFAGAKFIMTGLRFFSEQDILGQIKVAMDLHKRYPDSYLGYDLVGQEDPTHTLDYFLVDLLYPSEQNPPVNLPYFFHAAETNWQNTVVDYNLVDALLLNTTRIGHGYGLSKHPTLAQMVKKNVVPIEVNPISNQLLRLVDDPRNHAMIPLMADDFPVVLSSDDPTTWEAAPLSHDFFIAFMNMCGEDTGLRFLKQLAINSIKYSAMTDDEKASTMKLWQKKWDQFIAESIHRITSGNGVIDEVDGACSTGKENGHSFLEFQSENECSRP